MSDQDRLGGGSLWSQITKAVSDYQLNSVQAQVGVVDLLGDDPLPALLFYSGHR